VVCGDARSTRVEKRPEHAGREVIRLIVARRSTYKQLGQRSGPYNVRREIE
jgi:transposase, IS5 family